MRLRRDKDEVISVAIAADDSDLLRCVTENGYGERTRPFPSTEEGPRRHGREDDPADGSAREAGGRPWTGYQVMLISTGGTVIKMSATSQHEAPRRSTQGVIVISLREGELVSHSRRSSTALTTATTSTKTGFDQAAGADPGLEATDPSPRPRWTTTRTALQTTR